MAKDNRHDVILELIEKENISTQDELTAALQARGFKVSQGTVSRDIKDLKLVKISVGGVNRYSSVAAKSVATEDRLIPVLQNSFVSADCAGNLVVIKTLQGMAQAFAASIDSMHYEYILGTIAGDDTVLVVCRTISHTEELVKLLNKITR